MGVGVGIWVFFVDVLLVFFWGWLYGSREECGSE